MTSAAVDQRRGARPEPLPDQGQQPFAGDDAEPHPDLVEDDQRRGRERQHPEQLVAVAGAEDRVGGDPGRVVVGEAGEDAGTDHRQQRRDAAGAQQAVPVPGGPPVDVAAGRAVRPRPMAVWGFHGGPYPDAAAG